MDTAPHVLIIDDDQALLKLVGILLKKINAQAFTAENGAEALQIITSKPINLVVLDLMLPDMDGFEILQRIRSRPELNHVSVLILSAKADPATIRYALDNGADGYVTKPYISSNLIDRIKMLLNEDRAIKE